MPRRYFATFDYTEIVKGEPKEFVHQIFLEAADLNEAKVRANRHFEEFNMLNGLGWKRVLNRWRVVEAPLAPPTAEAERVPCRE
jgi:hypothetical protein